MSAPPRDGAARILAATCFDRNVVVAAGAGTGKTSLLVERLLNALGEGHAALDEIAAITFTDKAAGELRHRLAGSLTALQAIAGGAPEAGQPGEAVRAFAHLTARRGVPEGRIEARCGLALSRLDRASVTTIHGLCAEMLRAHPIETGLPPGFRVERGPVVERLAVEAWSGFVSEELGPGGVRAEIWTRALAALTLSDLYRLGRDLSRGAFSASLLEMPYAAASVELRAGAGRLAAQLRLGASVAGLSPQAREWLGAAASVLETLASEGPLPARGALARSGRLAKGRPNVRQKKVDPMESDRLEPLVESAECLLNALPALDDDAVEAAIEAVRPYARGVREIFARSGIADFDTLLVGARDLLRDRPRAREALKSRLRMLLVDEFQDTDPVQYEIVLLLAEVENGGGGDPWATRLAPGRLFVVGDAKQSIYRFRGADYAAYRRAIERIVGQGGLEVSLTSNFRSAPEVLAPVNALFGPHPGSSWIPSAYLPAYEPVVAEKPPAAGPSVEIWTTPESRASADRRRRAEGAALAGEIAAMVGAGSRRYGDVLVLFRSLSNLASYLRPLREAGIPYVVSGGKDFHERTEIVQAVALLRAVHDPADPIARLAFLRSPAGGVPDDEILRFAAARDAWTGSPVVDGAECPRVADALARLSSLRRDVEPLPIDARVREIVERSGLAVLAALGFDGAQRVANIEKLVTDAAAFSRDGRLSLEETIDALARRPRGEEEGESPLSDETTDAVRLMSIHKAKGLEAPVVILADAAAGRRNNGGEAEVEARVLRSPSGETIAVSGQSLVNAAEVLRVIENERHEAAEDIRLLYVALTRAKDRLVVIGGGRHAEAWTRALAPWGYDPKTGHGEAELLGGGGVLHRVLRPAARTAGPQHTAPPGAPAAVAAYEAASSRVREAGWTFLSPSLSDELEASPDDEARSPLAPSLARAVGSVVHERLERFSGDPAALVAGLAPASAAAAADNGVDPLTVADDARAVLEAFAASPLAARLAALDVVGRELPVLFGEDARRHWSGTIDLLYREPDGTIVVADYKTDASLEGALERHREQLRVYAEGVRRAIPGSRVRAELWMLRHGAVIAEPSDPTPRGALAR